MEKEVENDFRPEDLATNNTAFYELRIVIWNTRNVPLVDGDSKVNIKVKISFNDGKKNVEDETDVHYGSTDGVGEFNWRFVIPFAFPNGHTILTAQIYNHNLLSESDQIGSVNIDLKKSLLKIHRTKSADEIPREWVKIGNNLL